MTEKFKEEKKEKIIQIVSKITLIGIYASSLFY